MTFFEDLVQSRREGTAPPQVEQAGPPEPPEITFDPSLIPGAWSCGGPDGCGALVEGRLTDFHTAWHHDAGV